MGGGGHRTEYVVEGKVVDVVMVAIKDVFIVVLVKLVVSTVGVKEELSTVVVDELCTAPSTPSLNSALFVSTELDKLDVVIVLKVEVAGLDPDEVDVVVVDVVVEKFETERLYSD